MAKETEKSRPDLADELRSVLSNWYDALPSSDQKSTLTEDQKRILQDHGYW